METIDTIPLTITGLTINGKTYDGTTAATLSGTASLVTANVKTGDLVTLAGTPSAAFVNANAGVNRAVTITGLSLVGKDTHKYHLDLSGITATIEPKALTAEMITVTGGALTYTGTAQQPAITVQDDSTTLALDTDYENVTYTNNANAGTASVSATGKGNYQGTVSQVFAIAKASLTITGGTVATKTYDGTTGALITAVTFSGLQNWEALTHGTDYTVAGAVFDSAAAGGGRTVTATVALSGTPKASNYTLTNGALALTGQTVQKRTIADVAYPIEVFKNLANNYTLDYPRFAAVLSDLTGKDLGPITFTITSVTNTDGVLVDGEEPQAGLVTFPATMSVDKIADSGKEATIVGTVISQNYQDFTVTVTITTVDKIPVTISGVTMAGGGYNGSPHAYSGTPVFTLTTGGGVNISSYDLLYESTDGAGYSSSAAPTNAGAYQLTLSVPDVSIYTGSQAYAFTIAKRPVTVRAENKSITAGGALPTFTYTVDGQLTDETALIGTPALSSPTAITNTAGSYPITVDLSGTAYTSNYGAANPAFVGGTLTVNNPPSDGGGSYIPHANQIHIIGRTGGNLTYAGLTLTVPANALPANATLMILNLASQGTGGTLSPAIAPRLASDRYEIRSSGVRDLGEQTITVKIPYSPTNIGAGEQPIIHYYDEVTGEWTAVATAMVEENGQWYAVAPVSHLGQLAVFSTPIPEAPIEEPGEEPGQEPGEELAEEPRVIALTIGQTVIDLDGQTLELDVQPYVQAGRTMVPLRFIGEALGAQVEWYEDNQQVIIRRGDQWILLTIGSTRALVNGTPYDLDCTPEVIQPGRTMVPLRFIGEILGAQVDYDNQTGEIRLTISQ